jgi:predicted nucleic acid-binding protein
MILCDTNILIELYKGNPAITALVEHLGRKNIVVSDITLIELFFGTKNKIELRSLGKFLSALDALPVQPDISTMAVRLVNQYCLSHKLNLPDSLIAATAIYHDLELFTLNLKDFIFIPELKLYRPS